MKLYGSACSVSGVMMSTRSSPQGREDSTLPSQMSRVPTPEKGDFRTNSFLPELGAASVLACASRRL